MAGASFTRPDAKSGGSSSSGAGGRTQAPRADQRGPLDSSAPDYAGSVYDWLRRGYAAAAGALAWYCGAGPLAQLLTLVVLAVVLTVAARLLHRAARQHSAPAAGMALPASPRRPPGAGDGK